ncbi:transcriptional regulator, TetR family [Ruminococcus sp. YE71]|uniref:TetR/AcrR family transcriptional regulator n=1 Tax=unclassified Ruminococcus TaxID=2608920 RepID=UPI00087E1B5C|nr:MULTISPECIES: TetR/AcrR family transcriptional regulator [unclassified Ruminococcus]SDA25824.1 transcriptional regulator, TetR family [Ruminococcus sp. YE78]SFW35452.1 transcriptional regulator, TetR family [Ruminococcus sp. YE71]
MPKDKTQMHEKIIKAATDEFLEYGFENASMRRIAAEVGLTVGALYRHFASKEDMFSALVSPTVDELIETYREFCERGYEVMKCGDVRRLWNDSESETKWLMSFVYDHFNEFRLLICCSQGTKYESFLHDMAEMEERTTLDYFERMKQYGMTVNELSKKEFHMLVTANVSALFEAVIHGFEREEAMHYAQTLDAFFSAGWKKILGV